MATRLKWEMKHIIHPDQTCSVPGRSIFENLYLIRDIIHHCNSKRQRAFLLSLDFEKAFDKVDHSYLINTLRAFKFGDKFVNFIQHIYTDVKAQVNNNGYLTTVIHVLRGLRQGCPLSLPLYVIVAEPLASYARQYVAIQGFPAPGRSIPLKQTLYADNHTAITVAENSLNYVLHMFDMFEYASGCNLNSKKTEGLILGPNTTPPQTDKPILWKNDEGIDVLGVQFFPDLYLTQTYNWNKKLKKIKDKVQQLRYRTLSLASKRTLLNATVLSKLWYLAALFPIPPNALKTLNKTVFSFLWDYQSPEPLKRDTLFHPCAVGGLGLLHPGVQSEALRLKHLFNIVDPQYQRPWVHFARYWT